MHSALYYPHTTIEDPGLIKTSLLLWDTVTTIVPSSDFRPHYSAEALSEAWELVGRVHCPSENEKAEVHDIVKDFVDGPVLEEFLYTPNSLAFGEVYEIYPQKLLESTVQLLNQRGLLGSRLPNSDLPASQLMGLHLMNILADCCAGDEMARITDRQSAYDLLAGLLVEKHSALRTGETREAVISLTLDLLDLRSIELKKLIEFRKREEREATGWQYRELRHRYSDRIDEQLKKLRTAKGDVGRDAVREEFRSEMQDDVRSLKEALGANVFQSALTYTGLTSTVLVAAYEAVAHLVGWGGTPPTALTPVAATSAITGLLMLKSKFGKTRAEVLRKHPMAYLYCLK
jgi:hypothetical protein